MIKGILILDKACNSVTKFIYACDVMIQLGTTYNLHKIIFSYPLNP